MKTKMHRLLYVAAIPALLFTFILSLHPPKAFAATTGEFQDASTIKIGDKVYFDAKLDGDFTYKLQGGNSCEKITRDKGNTNSGTLYAPTSLNTDCQPQKITFTNQGASQDVFVWKDQATIATSDGRREYDQNASDGTVFNEVKDDVKGGGGCEDYFQTNDPTADTITIHFRTANKDDTPNTDSYPPHILDGKQSEGQVQGCYQWKKTGVKIAPYQDPSTVAGASVHGAATGGAGGSGSHDSNPTCEAGSLSINWILCPIYNGAADFSDWLFTHLVTPLLRTSPVSTDPTDPTYKIWSNFRIYGDIFLVIALLVIVFGQSIGGGMIDAYTAKKVLPRLLAAAILINLSVYIVAAMVDLINIVGQEVGKVITAPLKGAGAFNVVIHPSQGGTIIGLTGIAAALTYITVGLGAIPPLSIILLFVVMPAFFGLLAAFTVMVLRKAVILTLILVSPIAFALYCLPNTEKYFRKWWEFLFEWLAVYPIVVIIFAIADVLSVTVMQSNSNDPLAAVISFALQFIPLLAIPFAFRLAGGAVGRLHEVLTTSHKRLQEGIKGNPNNPLSLRNQAKRHYISNLSRSGNAIQRRGYANNATGWQRTRGRIAHLIDSNANARASRLTSEANELEEQESATGFDGYRYASNWFSFGAGDVAPGAVGQRSGLKDANGQDILGGTRFTEETYFDSKGRQISRAYAIDSERRHAPDEHRGGRNLEYALRKHQTDEDLANFRRATAAKAIRLGLNQQELDDLWARSTFEHKAETSSEWYSKPNLVVGPDGSRRIVWTDVADPTVAGRRNQNDQVNELHKARESFRLSSVRDEDYRSWDRRRNEIQDALDGANGGNVVSTGAPPDANDLRFLAETDEILESLVHQGVARQDPDAEGGWSVAGGTPASRGVITSLMNNRRYRAAPARTGATTPRGEPMYSTNERVIYRNNDVVRDSSPTTATNRNARTGALSTIVTAPPAMTREDAIDHHAVGRIDVTGDADRSAIPRVV